MIEITIGEDVYKGPFSWEDITLEQFIAVCEIEIPQRLRDTFVASSRLADPDPEVVKEAEKEYDKVIKSVTTRDLIRNFPEYYGKVMGALTDIPPDVLDRIDGTLREECFDKYFRYIILSVFYNVPVINVPDEGMVIYEPDEMVKDFELDGERYVIPSTLKLFDEKYYLREEPIISFAEAAEIDIALRDLMEKGAARLPMFMAIYCRPPDEPYNEAVIMAREQKMRGVTMDIVWTVFFCIERQSRLLGGFIQEFSRKVNSQSRSQKVLG